MKNTCIIITGPTAVGKTSLAIELAQHLSTQIISADSRQCFKELNIGVAKPSIDQLDLVKHYFINSHSIQDQINAVTFEKYALDAINQIFKKSKVAVMVGGTGLYIKSFCEGMDDISQIPLEIRTMVMEKYHANGIEWLTEMLQKKDLDFAKNGEMQNPQRMMRALEVTLSTGKSILSFQSQKKAERDFDIIKIGLELPREELYTRINNRVDEMIASGHIDEVRNLQIHKSLNALQTVGYREIFDFFDGKINEERAIELIKQNTRHYAKRQLTWFKKDLETTWLNPQFDQVRSYVNQTIKWSN